MKKRSLLFATLCLAALSATFVSCSDDDPEDKWSWEEEGSSVEMVRTRGFVLNEGSYGLNNSHLTYFDYAQDTIYANDIFETQNGKAVGDTGQDLVAYDGNLYLIVNGSNYIAKLNGVGKEEARYSFANNAELGEVRYAAANDDYLYVTSYGGYVSKFNAETLEYIGSVQVGNNPEQIIVEDGKIYCVNSGWGYDNRLSIIDEATFTLDENVEIMTNPQRIISVMGTIVIQGYGGAYGSYTYPVDIYNPTTKTCTTIGTGTNIAALYSQVLVMNAEVDYSTYPDPYTGTISVYSYDTSTGTVNTNPLDLPAEATTACGYGLSVDESTGSIYLLTTNYTWGNGTVYHFSADGSYIGKFSSGGQNPNKVVCLY